MKKLVTFINYNEFCLMANNYNIEININKDDYKNYVSKFNFSEQLSLL